MTSASVRARGGSSGSRSRDSSVLAPSVSMPGRSGTVPAGRVSHEPYRTAWASAATARSGVRKDGTDPRAALPSAAAGKVVSTGTVASLIADRSAAACARPVVATIGTYTTTSACTSGRPSAVRTAAAKSSGLTSIPRSWGRPSATRSPAYRQASTASMPNAVELPMTATRSPTGTGWVDSSWATSKASARVSVLITPDCANRLSTAAPDIAGAPGPGIGVKVACRPDFTAITGFVRASTRANRANLRGLPNDSRYSSTTSVASSPYQNCSRSFPDTSARLPADTNVDNPSPRFAASARIAIPNAPDWQKKPTRPGGGTSGANDPFIRTD